MQALGDKHTILDNWLFEPWLRLLGFCAALSNYWKNAHELQKLVESAKKAPRELDSLVAETLQLVHLLRIFDEQQKTVEQFAIQCPANGTSVDLIVALCARNWMDLLPSSKKMASKRGGELKNENSTKKRHHRNVAGTPEEPDRISHLQPRPFNSKLAIHSPRAPYLTGIFQRTSALPSPTKPKIRLDEPTVKIWSSV